MVPDHGISIETLDNHIARELAMPQPILNLLVGAGLVTLILAAIGVCGVMSFYRCPSAGVIRRSGGILPSGLAASSGPHESKVTPIPKPGSDEPAKTHDV